MMTSRRQTGSPPAAAIRAPIAGTFGSMISRIAARSSNPTARPSANQIGNRRPSARVGRGSRDQRHTRNPRRPVSTAIVAEAVVANGWMGTANAPASAQIAANVNVQEGACTLRPLFYAASLPRQRLPHALEHAPFVGAALGTGGNARLREPARPSLVTRVDERVRLQHPRQ